MIITKKDVSDKLQDYLVHKATIDDLVGWAETAVMDYAFDDDGTDVIRHIVTRLGLADVKAFGITWEDCESYINLLGYKVKLEFEYV